MTSPPDVEKMNSRVEVQSNSLPGVSTPNGVSTPPEKPAFELVEWNSPDDPGNPQNWPLRTKLLRSSAPLAVIFSISFASSVFGAATGVTAQEYAISQEVMSLGVALCVAGYAVGPLVFAPMAEVLGSAIVLSVALTGCAIFQIPLAVAQNVSTILVSRFLAGTLGAGGLAVGSGILADVYGPIHRGVAVGLSAAIMNLGSTIAPIVGNYVVARYTWRWTAWITLVLQAAVGLLCMFLLRETSHNRILMWRAARLRRETRNENLRARAETVSLNPRVLLRKYGTKPVRMFCKEPILQVMTLYLILVYGSLYLSYQLFPRAFQAHGWSVPASSLPFLAVGLGVMTALVMFSWFTLTWYKTRWEAWQTTTVDCEGSGTGKSVRIAPEHRLPPMVLGAVMLPPALLWFGWSGNTHWSSQLIASFFIGLALQIIFISGIVYIVDVYQPFNVVSAISIHVMMRSLVSATFPMFEGPMYEALHIEYTATLLAVLSAVIMVSPILLIIYGPRIRSWSRFSVGGI
ncbi:hypothetical protein N7492_001709 [Penicillium capsulatum]|uniref:Major facilitator superfamily (MFS) profile domain-containing protein n=1 Tax=Penicillium capsulatum TaxID=69766 RepID=A0A9W9IS14_9EURO|nr:hypothetical protein N7492_001709 [Penicillium capsulatum]KAJ6129240.1 hypothetical protein N7512_002020 [Penicillium capsulatum]